MEMFLFISILLVGLFYVWKKGDLDWVKMEIRNPKGRYKHLARKD
jgi:NADH-quinone oxidoreductase subunit A